MYKQQNNFAFIDSQNLNLAVRSLGWKLDYRRFRVYLEEKYAVKKAFLFIGYGDFYCLVKYWLENNKLEKVLIPNFFKYSALLKRFGKKQLSFMNDLQNKLQYQKKDPPRTKP